MKLFLTSALALLFCSALAQGELRIYNWSGYTSEEMIAAFEEETGINVSVDTYDTNETLLAKLKSGNTGYDIVVPSETVLYPLIGEGLLEPLDKANIPNLANVSESYLNLPVDPDNTYSVPYQIGTVGIGYNKTVVGEITGWEDLLTYGGPVAWLEDLRAMMAMSLTMLGYDPNTADPDEIAEARDYLVENGSNVVYIAQDDGQELLVRGEADIVIEYSGDIFQIIDECGCDDYAYVIPEEGAQLAVDNLAIPVGAQNKALAEVFIDYILDPQVGADVSNYTAYGSPNEAAITEGLIDEDLLNDPGIYPPGEVRARFFSIVNDPELEELYNNAWDEVKIFVGGG